MYRSRHNKNRIVANGGNMRVRYFIPLILLLALIAFLTVILKLQYFNVTDMVFSGNVKYTDNLLMKETNLKIHENGFKQLFEQGGKLYMLRFSKEEKHLMTALPYIKSISIKYRMPNQIIYSIEEREPVFYTGYLGTYLILDQEGTVLEVSENPYKDELIFLSGFSFTTFKIGEKTDTEGADKIDYAYRAYITICKNDTGGDYGYKFLPLIREFGFADKKNMHINIDDIVLAIIPLNEDIEYNITSLQDIFFKNIKSKGKGILDFTGVNPIFTPYAQVTD